MENNPQISEALFANQESKIEQRNIINSIEVANVNEIIPVGFQKIIEENKDFYGIKLLTPDKECPDHKIFLKKSKNDIILIQNLLSDGDSMRVFGSYLVDKQSEKAFSIDSLDAGKIFYSTNLFSVSNVIFFGHGGEINWNENKLQNKMIDWKFGKGMSDFLNIAQLFHEMGHVCQIRTMDSEQINSQPNVKNLVKDSKSVNDQTDYLIEGKKIVKEQERNAWAFSLSLTEKLKGLGMNLTRGLDSQRIKDAIDFFLLTYDKGLSKIPGNQISNRERKLTVK